MERNTVERAIKTEMHTKTEKKGVGKLDQFMSDINRSIPPDHPPPPPREGEPGGTHGVRSFLR